MSPAVTASAGPRSAVPPSPSWSEADRARYRAAGYWTDETFAGFVADRCQRFASHAAIVGVDAHGREARWSYADLLVEADRVAGGLRALGVTPGDRVVVALPNIVEYAATILGVFRLGALPVFALPTHREVELAQFCQIADAAALVGCGPELKAVYDAVVERLADGLGGTVDQADRVDPPVLVDVAEHTWDAGSVTDGPGSAAGEERAAPGAEETGFLQLSGGTTGISKLIPRTAADYLYSVRASAEICGLSSAA